MTDHLILLNSLILAYKKRYKKQKIQFIKLLIFYLMNKNSMFHISRTKKMQHSIFVNCL